jgi:drug/metabolite transporter (DMT)-like permease
VNASSEAAGAASSNLTRAALLMVASAVLFGFMTVTIRLASKQLHAFEIAFFRSLFGFVFATPLLLRHGPALLRTDKWGFYLLRCCIGIVSMLAGFWAVVHLPLAQAISLSYSTPLFVTIGAVLFLGEVVRLRRWTAVLLGFIGVLVIVRPGAADFSAVSLVALLAAALSGTVAISIKFLSRTEHPDAIVLITTGLWVLLALPAAIPVWQWPNAESWLWVILAGGFGTVAHLLWTRALKLGEVSALTPLSFLQLPVVILFGFFLFNERLDLFTIIGAAIIVGSNVYIAHRETRLARRVITDEQVAGETKAPQ